MSIVDLIDKYLLKANCPKPPGSPPRPGLEWNTKTCRWIRPKIQALKTPFKNKKTEINTNEDLQRAINQHLKNRALAEAVKVFANPENIAKLSTREYQIFQHIQENLENRNPIPFWQIDLLEGISNRIGGIKGFRSGTKKQRLLNEFRKQYKKIPEDLIKNYGNYFTNHVRPETTWRDIDDADCDIIEGVLKRARLTGLSSGPPEFRNDAEAHIWFKEKHDVTLFNLDKYESHDVKEDIYYAIDALKTRFPAVTLKFFAVDDFSNLEGYNDQYENSLGLHFGYSYGSRIALGLKHSKHTSADWRNITRECENIGFHPINSSIGIESIIAHEFGHAIEHTIKQVGSESVKNLLTAINNEFGSENSVSTYARKNASEHFAELFQYCYHNSSKQNETQAVRHMRELIKQMENVR